MEQPLSPYRVISVCTGNICRSPMAEFMLAAAFAEAGLDDVVTVDSAGITAYEAGNPIDPLAAQILAAHNIRSHTHRARGWRTEWFKERHLILALDVDHYGWLRASAPDEESRARVRMLRSFDPALEGGHPLDQGIENPWSHGPAEFEAVWEKIQAAVPGIVRYIQASAAPARVIGNI